MIPLPQPEPRLVLDDTRCTRCGACVGVCPTMCLAFHGPAVWMPRPGDCVRCQACVVVCEPGAISWVRRS
ncbi:MAG: ATP-binding protein [Fimbriiglobus sp.]